MGSVNKVILVGNLGKDAEVRVTPGGQSVASFSIATTENWTSREGEKKEQTEWHRIVLWGKTADSLQPYLVKGKQIHINKGHALSLQYHNKKDETIFVWSGKILFEQEIDGRLVGKEMGPGDAVHVTPPTVHRMTAIEDTDVFEVSTPETDDVVRLEDRYGRKTEVKS